MKYFARRYPETVLLLCAVAGALVATVIVSLAQPMVREQHLAFGLSAPNVITVTTTPQTVFVSNQAVNDGRVLLRTIQNTGTVPVLYAVDATVSASAYHGVIAAGLADRDGLGGMVNLGRLRGNVTVATEAGTGTICVVELTQ